MVFEERAQFRREKGRQVQVLSEWGQGGSDLYSEVSRADVAVAGDDEFVGADVGSAHGAAGVEFVGGDADFGTKARKTALPRPLMRRFLQASCVRAKGPD